MSTNHDDPRPDQQTSMMAPRRTSVGLAGAGYPNHGPEAFEAEEAEQAVGALAQVGFGGDSVELSKVDRMAVPGFERLASVLRDAYAQAAVGKGKQRHAVGEQAFTDQLIVTGAKTYGVGSLLFQAHKKADESQRMEFDPAVRELQGAIVYLAAAIIVRQDRVRGNGA